jgi:sulfite reductase alpha subunit-like flavoprotein
MSKLTIIYASETGTAEDVAYNLFDFLSSHHSHALSCSITSIDTYDVSLLPSESDLIFVVSTTGDGECPAGMRTFWRFLLRKNLSAESLQNVKIGIFGLGDSSYEKFNAAARRLSMRVKQLGAQELVSMSLGDDQAAHGYFTAYQTFCDNIASVYNLNGEQAQQQKADSSTAAIDATGGRRNPPEYSVSVCPSSIHNSTYSDLYVSYQHRPPQYYHPPADSKFPTPFHAKCTQNMRMTDPQWPQDVRHITLDIKDSLANFRYTGDVEALEDMAVMQHPFVAGDVATVHPLNEEALVERCMALLPGINERSDEMSNDSEGVKKDQFLIINRDGFVRGESQRQSRLMDCNVTVHELLLKYLDISGNPRRSFFTQLSQWATSEEEAEKLVELASPEGTDLYHDYVIREKRNYVEVLEEFRSARPPLERLLEMIPPLQPRHYSIASSSISSSTRIDLCVAVEEKVTPYKRKRKGLCSSYLADCKLGQEVVLWIRRGSFINPTSVPIFLNAWTSLQSTLASQAQAGASGLSVDMPAVLVPENQPVILIGPGTGVAPMRALLQERQALDQMKALYDNDHGNVQETPSTVLFFGCRKQKKDFLFSSEWTSLPKLSIDDPNNHDPECYSDGNTQISMAFSQDGGLMEAKTYVMSKMRLHAALLWRMISQGAYIFIAGSAKRMPIDVRKCFEGIIMNEGGMDAGAADKYLKMMERQNRYVVEAWSS